MTSVEIPIDSLVTEGHPVAQVSESVMRKVSDAEKWGSGTWDKIPWTVSVHSSVTLNVDQEHKSVRRAQNMAYELAWSSTRRHMAKAIIEHAKFLREELYPGLFGDDDG